MKKPGFARAARLFGKYCFPACYRRSMISPFVASAEKNPM